MSQMSLPEIGSPVCIEMFDAIFLAYLRAYDDDRHGIVADHVHFVDDTGRLGDFFTKGHEHDPSTVSLEYRGPAGVWFPTASIRVMPWGWELPNETVEAKRG